MDSLPSFNAFSKIDGASQSFGPTEIDPTVNKYIDAFEIWVVGYLDWSSASKRYFGQASEDVKKTRIVELCPQKSES
jgi:hypothetical protein